MGFLAALLPMLMSAGSSLMSSLAGPGLMGNLGQGFMSMLGQGLAGKLLGGQRAGQQPPQAGYATAPPPTVTTAQPMNLEELIGRELGNPRGGPQTLLPSSILANPYSPQSVGR